MPKPVITTAMRATSPRLARLSLVRNDMCSPVKVRPRHIVCPTRTNGFRRGPLIASRHRTDALRPPARTTGGAVAENERLIADIMQAQQRLQHLFAYDRSDPLFASQLTMPQLKILLLLYRLGDTSGRELAGILGVSLATMSGMVDRLVAHDLVTRAEDPNDRRVRRITLSGAGQEMIGSIITAGAEKQARL